MNNKYKIYLIIFLLLVIFFIIDRLFLEYEPKLYCEWRPNWICGVTPECSVSRLYVNGSLFETGGCVNKFIGFDIIR